MPDFAGMTDGGDEDAVALPPSHFVRTAEKLRHPLVMRKVVDDGPHRELALHMKRRLELARGEQVSIDAAQALRFDIDEQARAAFAAVKRGFRFSLHVVGSPRTTLTASAG
jgi:hypothetical protein